MASGTIRAVRGDSLILPITYTNAAGDLVPLETFDIAAEIAIGGQVYATTVERTGAGAFRVTAPEGAVQRVGLATMDVEFSVDGVRQSAFRWLVSFEQDVTNAA